MPNIWDIIFDEHTSAPYDSRSLQEKLNEIDRQKRQQEFDEALKKLLFGDEDRSSGPLLLRNLVECTAWFVPIDIDGSLKIKQVERGQHKLAIGEPKSVRGKKGGKGGRLLLVYAEPPEKQVSEFRCISGVELVGAIDDITGGVDGFVLHQKDNPPLELGSEYFEELKSLVLATQLEATLAVPGPDQIEPLKQATFLVNINEGKPESTSGVTFDSRLMVAYTHKDALSSFTDNRGLVPVTGEELFRMLADDEKFDGLIVNPITKVGAGSQRVHRLILSPGFAHHILQGIDIRPGAAPLPARTFEEVKMWLELARFPSKSRKLIDAPLPDTTLVRANSPDNYEWTMIETDGKKGSQTGPIWSPVFSLPPDVPPQVEQEPWSLFPGVDRSEYGSGPTRILCAGMMATLLNPRWKSNPKDYNFGKWFLLGRYIDSFSRREARQRLAIARELLKLIPAGEERIPRSALLTVKGTAYLREYPIGGTRQWIESVIEYTERCTKIWVWGW